MKDILNATRVIRKTAIDNFSPSQTVCRIFDRPLENATPSDWTMEIVVRNYILQHKNAYRPFFAALNTQEAQTLSRNEQVGLGYFLALIGWADNLVDENKAFKSKMTPEAFRHKLMTSIVPNTDIPLDAVLQKTLSFFPDNKKQAIDTFLHKTIEVQARLGSQVPGEYSYNQVYRYKMLDTNSELIAIGMNLINITNPQTIAVVQEGMKSFQLKDDREDLAKDWKEETMNLLIGMAAANPKEFAKLKEYIEKEGTSPSKEWLEKELVHTYAVYKNEIRKVKKGLSSLLLFRIVHRSR